MSLLRLANGHKYEIDQPNEGEGMLRNRKRNTVKITFRAGAEQFDAIREDIKPANLEPFTIYYPDNETADEPDEQLDVYKRQELAGVKDQTGLMLKSVYDADNDGYVDMYGSEF